VKIFPLVVLTGLLIGVCSASDQAREQSHANDIVASLVVGEAVWLSDGELPFLALYTEATEASGNAVLLMHGTGAHPNWAEVIFPLREGLPEQGWAALSMQMPIGAREASFDEYLALFPEVPARIEAALQYLHEQGQDTVILIGHSLGAMMGTHYLAQHDQSKVQGFIAIGLSAADVPPVSVPENISKIRVPMLDLYGSDDFPNVKSTAWVRRSAASDNPTFSQIEAEGADHFFRGQDAALLQHVSNWLATQPTEAN